MASTSHLSQGTLMFPLAVITILLECPIRERGGLIYRGCVLSCLLLLLYIPPFRLPFTYPHTLLETNMTILHTVEPRVNGFPKNPPSKLLYKEALPAVPVSFTQVRPGLEPAQLMRKFVKQYNELQNYKYVVHEWPSTLLVAYHTPVLLQERRQYHA